MSGHSEELHMPDERKRADESPKPAEPEKGSEDSSNPTAAEQKDIEDVVADELNDDRFQASDN
jgi:hypothetical protein